MCELVWQMTGEKGGHGRQGERRDLSAVLVAWRLGTRLGCMKRDQPQPFPDAKTGVVNVRTIRRTNSSTHRVNALKGHPHEDIVSPISRRSPTAILRTPLLSATQSAWLLCRRKECLSENSAMPVGTLPKLSDAAVDQPHGSESWVICITVRKDGRDAEDTCWIELARGKEGRRTRPSHILIDPPRPSMIPRGG